MRIARLRHPFVNQWPRIPLRTWSRTSLICLRYNSSKTEGPLRERATVLQAEHAQLTAALLDSYDAQKAVQLGRLDNLVSRLRQFDQLLANVPELQALATMTDDPDTHDADVDGMIELRDDAMHELVQVKAELGQAQAEIERLLVPAHAFAGMSCILELRPGVGGSEAALFTRDLLAMYVSLCQQHKWKHSIISASSSSGGATAASALSSSDGLIEAILSVDHDGTFDRLQFEGGVHRVQRIPDTETKGRVHTSTAAVVVLPHFGDGGSGSGSGEDAAAAAAAERAFKPGEVRVDVMRARGAGGQHVNTTESAVRLTHLPTGITVSMQDSRSQHKNKAKAFMILRSRIANAERQAAEELERASRTSQVSTTDRTDKIRTYNYAQNRVTDHRCGYSVFDLTGCMQGGSGLDSIIDHVAEWARQEQVKQLLVNSSNSSTIKK
ncbi:hypothetical protein V1514DRAFT_335562 [Lipomyces japonicus]|uniref:uncharacterized protein n=1 Tax=Lipomyces japonicus TaxID=56871 RepID=UPI0034CF01E2